jgi:hypothetical protein
MRESMSPAVLGRRGAMATEYGITLKRQWTRRCGVAGNSMALLLNDARDREGRYT